jgi:hypothetical protein
LSSEAVTKCGAFLFTESSGGTVGNKQKASRGREEVTVRKMSEFVLGVLERVVISGDAS